jgi:hypothetical protein
LNYYHHHHHHIVITTAIIIIVSLFLTDGKKVVGLEFGEILTDGSGRSCEAKLASLASNDRMPFVQRQAYLGRKSVLS